MNSIETLEKYGLQTGAMNIAGRLLNDIYRKLLKDFHPDMSNEELTKAAKECKSADLELICELALKGEQALTELVESSKEEHKKLKGENDGKKVKLVVTFEQKFRNQEEADSYLGGLTPEEIADAAADSFSDIQGAVHLRLELPDGIIVEKDLNKK